MSYVQGKNISTGIYVIQNYEVKNVVARRPPETDLLGYSGSGDGADWHSKVCCDRRRMRQGPCFIPLMQWLVTQLGNDQYTIQSFPSQHYAQCEPAPNVEEHVFVGALNFQWKIKQVLDGKESDCYLYVY